MVMRTLSGYLVIQGGGGAANPAQSAPQTPATTRQNPAGPNSRELRDQIREQIRTSIQAAQEAQADAQANVPNPPVPALPPEPSRNLTIRGPNGEQTIIGIPPTRDMIPPQAVDISLAFFFTIAAIIIGLPIARAFARRMDRKSTGTAQIPGEVTAQLTHLSQAVDAIALEVERISEGQRFTTRLLSEQRDAVRHTLPSGADR